MTGAVTHLGRGAVRRVALVGALARFFFEALTAIPGITRAGRRVASRVLLQQVWFTALQAIVLVVLLAAILSFLVISQATRELGRLGASELIGRLMVVVIVRELGPLVTALAVAGRSGTAIAAELATNKVMGEVNALRAMGIDPVHYHVLPRLGAVMLSLFGLIILFDLVAIFAGLVAASLTFRDVWITAVKGLVFGLIVGLLPCFHGLRIRGVSTEVPIASSQAAVGTIVTIFVCSGLFVVLLT